MAWFVWFVGLVAGPASAQGLTPTSDAYLALLERYASGDADGAARAMLEFEPGKTREAARTVVDDVEAEILALRGLSPDKRATVPTQGSFTALRRRRLRTLKLALLVHTEAGLRVAVPHTQVLIAKDVVDRLWRLESDFERFGPLPVSAAGQSHTVITWNDVRLFVRDWYLLVVSQLAALGHMGTLKAHIDDGLERFKNDPELLLARGWLAEVDAEASIVDRSLMRKLYTHSFIARWRMRLYDARDDYRRALDRQPDLAEARLRWGRVRGLLGETSGARVALGEVANGSAQGFLRYLAWLFLAESSELTGDRTLARTEYEKALTCWPRANAPKLALSRLCLAAGEDGCARAWLIRSLLEANTDRTDPWWDYLQGQSWRGDDRLRSLRARGLAP